MVLTEVYRNVDDIPNIGAKRRRALLSHFGSIEKIKKSTKEELLEVDSMDNKSVESVLKYFGQLKQ